MTDFTPLTRRRLLGLTAATASLALAGCTRPSPDPSRLVSDFVAPSDARRLYAAIPDERYPIPAVNLARLDSRYYRKEVDDPTGEQPGTLVVDTSRRYLYLVREGGRAIRYGVGIGRDGFEWAGRGYIAMKKTWPTWTPPASMIARQPELAEFRDGMPPGLMNPLGARALYIFQGGRDTLYRLHGNPDESSIGKAVSSGCVRLLNQDVIDLYDRVPVSTRILVT